MFSQICSSALKYMSLDDLLEAGFISQEAFDNAIKHQQYLQNRYHQRRVNALKEENLEQQTQDHTLPLGIIAECSFHEAHYNEPACKAS